VKPGEKTVRDFANEEGVGFNALTYRLYSCPEGAAARGKGEVSDQDLTSGTSWELARSLKWRFWGGWVWVMLG